MQRVPGYLQVFFKVVLQIIKNEYFSDALRTTLSIIVPFAALYYFTDPHIAITVGVGALLVSLTDSPGTLGDKVLMSVSSLCLFFFIAIITALLIKKVMLSGMLILVFCMIFGLFTAFGKRWSLLGTMALILMTFVQGLRPVDPLSFSLYIVAGGVFYYLVSLVQTSLWPLSSVKHALGECIISTSDFLRAKAAFYDAGSNLQQNYLQLIKLHNKVHDKQEQVRDLLLRNKSLMRNGHEQGQRYLLALTQVIDLYERIGAIQYDYELLRESLKDTGLLDAVTRVIGCLANDLQLIGDALYGKFKIKSIDTSAADIQFVKQQIAKLSATDNNTRILNKLEINIDEIYTLLRKISTTLTFKFDQIDFPADLPAYQFFISAELISFSVLKTQLNFRSPVFRFACRLSAACLVAFSFTLLPVGYYSYWILLTVIVVIKPGFGLTNKRNLQRLKGSLLGVAIGMILLLLIGNITVKLMLAGLFLLGYFAYLRINYMLSIVSLTPMIIICLNIYTGNQSIVLERVVDTLLGCAIAFGASYLFPSWEIRKHSMYIGDVVRANLSYLKKLHDQTAGIPSDITSFKLARKEVYTKLTILSSGIQNMLLEPKRAQSQVKHLYEFEVLSHQLSSTIASFFPFSNVQLVEVTQQLNRAMEILKETLMIVDDSTNESKATVPAISYNQLDLTHPDHVEQHKVQQILRIAEAIRQQVYQYSCCK